MQVKYVGPAKDYSGYGECSRHDIAALVRAGIDVSTEIPNYTLEVSDYGELGQIARDREDKEIDYKIKILHVTPNVYGQYIEPGKFHIGRVMWETDKLPQDFARNLNLLQEIWTGSEFNKQAILNSGVRNVPIRIMPEAIEINTRNVEPYMAMNTEDYCFYSIFEWTERKNPEALLTAFWLEFADTDKVSLTIKTYLDNFTPKKREEIDHYVKRIKKKLQLTRYAPIYLVTDLMDRHQVYRFHKTYDCFVSAHRGEGWGIPQMEAMVMSNPIISTNLGGVHEYLKDGVDALLPSYRLIPLKSNNRNQQWYTQDQNWGDVDIDDLKAKMRLVYQDRNKAKAIGIAGKRTIEKLFSIEVVGQKMKERLKVIAKEIES